MVNMFLENQASLYFLYGNLVMLWCEVLEKSYRIWSLWSMLHSFFFFLFWRSVTHLCHFYSVKACVKAAAKLPEDQHEAVKPLVANFRKPRCLFCLLYNFSAFWCGFFEDGFCAMSWAWNPLKRSGSWTVRQWKRYIVIVTKIVSNVNKPWNAQSVWHV